MNASRSTNDLSALQLCRWLAPYAWRRRFELAIVVATMLVRIGLDLLKPWPMVFLVDYVLQGKTTSAILPSLADLLPGPHSPGNLIGWSVGATVLIFLFSWAVGVAHAYSGEAVRAYVVVATGHFHEGFTTSAITGEIVVDLITMGISDKVYLDKFKPDRFNC